MYNMHIGRQGKVRLYKTYNMGGIGRTGPGCCGDLIPGLSPRFRKWDLAELIILWQRRHLRSWGPSPSRKKKKEKKKKEKKRKKGRKKERNYE